MDTFVHGSQSQTCFCISLKGQKKPEKLKSSCWSLPLSLSLPLCAGVDVSLQETPPPSGYDPYSWQVLLNICQPNPWHELCFCTHFILFCFERLPALYLGELELCWIHQGQCHRLRTFKKNKPPDSLRSSTDNKPLFSSVFDFMQSVYFVCGHLKGFILCDGRVKQADSGV